MDLFAFTHPKGHRRKFASCFVSGDVTWEHPGEICATCFLPNYRRRLAAYTISWEPGSSVVPDLMLPFSSQALIVSDRLCKVLQNGGFSGFTVWPITIADTPVRSESDFAIVPYPYVGPPLWDIYVDPREIVRLVPENSTVQFQGHCQKCGAERWIIPEDADNDNQFFVVNRKSWHGQDFMLPLEINGLFVTERVAEVIRKGNFTNVEIQKVGRMSD